MKTLVLAEKPSVGRDIARVLGCTKKLEGAIEGTDYVVTWGLGHLVELGISNKNTAGITRSGRWMCFP